MRWYQDSSQALLRITRVMIPNLGRLVATAECTGAPSASSS